MFKKRIWWLGLAILGLGVLGYWSEYLIYQHYRPNAQWFSASDGTTTRYMLRGEEHPGPVYVFEHGMEGDAEQLRSLQEELSQFVPVLTRDRLSMGWSRDSLQLPFDAKSQSQRLQELVDHVIPGRPLILVGYSFGGIYVRVARELMMNKVLGMVLIDPSHEKMLSDIPPEYAQEDLDYFKTLHRRFWISRFGLLHVPLLWRSLSVNEIKHRSGWHLGGSYAEVAVIQESFDQVARTQALGDMPVLIFSARLDSDIWESRRQFDKLHDRLLSLGRRTHLEIIPEADHFTVLEPRFAVSMTKSILEFFQPTRLDLVKSPARPNRSSPDAKLIR